MNNILDTDLDFRGRDVYVVGSGPNGVAAYDRVPDDAETIGINKAALYVSGIEQPHVNWWLCVTPALLREQWFLNMMFMYKLAKPKTGIIFAKGPLTDAYPDVPYTFARGRDFDIGSMGIEQGKLRRGAGTVGVALQLAQQLGAERCILVGVDMHGKDYFDGTRNENKSSIGPDGTWSQIAMLQRLINCLKQGGMDVVSLSKTKLGVEVI